MEEYRISRIENGKIYVREVCRAFKGEVVAQKSNGQTFIGDESLEEYEVFEPKVHIYSKTSKGFWQPGQRGYTEYIEMAGWYFLQEAMEIVSKSPEKDEIYYAGWSIGKIINGYRVYRGKEIFINKL